MISYLSIDSWLIYPHSNFHDRSSFNNIKVAYVAFILWVSVAYQAYSMAALYKYCTCLVIIATSTYGVWFHEVIVIRSIICMKHRPHSVDVLVRQLVIIFEFFFYHAPCSKVNLTSDLIISWKLLHLIVLLLDVVYCQIILRLLSRWSFCPRNFPIWCKNMRWEIEVSKVIQGRIDVIARFVEVLHCANCPMFQLKLSIVYTHVGILKISNLFWLARRPH